MLKALRETSLLIPKKVHTALGMAQYTDIYTDLLLTQALEPQVNI